MALCANVRNGKAIVLSLQGDKHENRFSPYHREGPEEIFLCDDQCIDLHFIRCSVNSSILGLLTGSFGLGLGLKDQRGAGLLKTEEP